MRKLIAMILALTMAASLFAGCGGSDAAPVSVQSVGMLTGLGPVGVFDRFAGVVEAGQSVNVQRDSNMELDEVLVSVGDSVQTGQTLFTYNTESMALELDKLNLEIEQIKNSQATKKDQIKTLEAEKKKASESSQLSYTLQIQSLEVEIKEADFNITSKKKSVEAIQATLADSSVVSPCDGTIKSINKDGGSNGYDDYGTANGGFIVITQAGEYRIKGTVNEQNRAMISVDMPVIIRSRANADTTWAGTISLIDTDNPIQNNNGWGPVNDEATTSSSYPFYIDLSNAEGLMIGQHVYIEPDFGQQEQQEMALPAYFIVQEDNEAYVWAANEDDELEKRDVTLGSYDPAADTYVILAGLEASDYIAAPSELCESGAPVNRYDDDSFGGMPGDIPDDGLVGGWDPDMGESYDDGGSEDYGEDWDYAEDGGESQGNVGWDEDFRTGDTGFDSSPVISVGDASSGELYDYFSSSGEIR